VTEYFEGLAEERRIRLSIAGDATLNADPLLLRRALSNLVANAIRYADPHSEVQIDVASTPTQCVINVENQGPALDPATLTHLFDRFYRGDASRQHNSDSNGLGLAIVAAIMQLHAGEASVSQPQPGRIRFALSFPVLGRS